MKKEIFLKKESLDTAKEKFRNKLKELEIHKLLNEVEIPSVSALGRITSRQVIAKISNTFYNTSAVDGFATISHLTASATIVNPVKLKIGKDAIKVNTGDPIDFPFDTVVMIEDVEEKDGYVYLFAPHHFYENVRVVGEDYSKGEVIIPVYEKIRPEHIGLLISSLNETVFVFEKPKIFIIATGEEVKRLNEEIKKGDVIDSNSFMVSSIIESFGGEAYVSSQVLPNDEEIIKKAIIEASSKYHAVIVIAGSAKGTKDFTKDVFESIGEVLFHGVSIQPGKPIVVGFYGKTPLIGLPGFPVSNYIDAMIFLKILFEELLGYSLDVPTKINAVIKRDIPSSIGVEEFIRVKVSKIKDEIVCVPLKRGAANLSSVANGDGILRIEEELEGIPASSKVEIDLLKSFNEVSNQLLFIGSNDPLLEFLFNFAKKKDPHFKFGIVNAGSLQGLLSFSRGETLITSIHLFDSDTKTYNTPYIEKFLKGKSFVRILFALRNQGLIVKKGNPKKINSLKDLEKEDVRFINRQKGSGTRVFFDYLLQKESVDKTLIKGYEIEETTHIGVANAILNDVADVGLGIEYVANLFDLDFIKLGEEEYELIVDLSEFESARFKYFWDTLNSKEFLDIIKSFNGYTFKGEILEVRNEKETKY